MAEVTEADRDRPPTSKLAEPDERAYPIEDAARAENAKIRATQAMKASCLSWKEAGT